MVRTKCNLCENGEFSEILRRKNLLACKNCGLVFFKKQPRENEIIGLYNKEIFSPAKYYKRLEAADTKNFMPVFGEVKKHKKPGVMLDIGCSTGTFMDLASRRNWNVYGMEINKKSLEECKKKKLNVVNSVLTDSSYKDNFFDWIHMGDVIEHVKDPNNFLRIAYKKLKKGGILTISTPDISKFMARKFQIKPNEHLFYFNKKTIRMYLEKTGLKIINVKNYSPYRNLSALSESSTFKRNRAKILLRALGMFGDIIVKMPLKDEMLIVARKP